MKTKKLFKEKTIYIKNGDMFYLSKENFNKEEMNLDQLILEL